MLPLPRFATLPSWRSAVHAPRAPLASTRATVRSSRPLKSSFVSRASIARLALSSRTLGLNTSPFVLSSSSLRTPLSRSYTAAASDAPGQDELATIHWVLKTGETVSITEKVGMNLLDIAHKHGIELEGACEASLACSTCHIIVEDPNLFEKTGEITDEENDMLDLAFGLTETSRLGCQVILTKDLDGMHVRLPSATRNMMVDGHVPKPH